MNAKLNVLIWLSLVKGRLLEGDELVDNWENNLAVASILLNVII